MSGDKLWKLFQQQHVDDATQLVNIESAGAPRAGVSRRTFIEMIGFSAAALAFSSCRAPEQKIIPFLKQPVEFTPGVASWFASTCGGCGAGCGVLVKVRDGRPIKIEGNPEHPLNAGGLCAVAHGMVFGLYDSDRLRQPLIASKPATWEDVDRQIIDILAATRKTGEKVRVLTGTINSPASLETVSKFLTQFKDGKHVMYEAVSAAAIREAHSRTHKTTSIPQYRIDKAKLVVSFGADFLGTWIAPTQHSRGYSTARDLSGGSREMSRDNMSRHVQFESLMSLTGSNADTRIKVSPSEETGALLLLAKLTASKETSALAALDESSISSRVREAVHRTANELLELRGESLVISGSNDIDVQCVVNVINQALGNYGKTLDLNAPSQQNQGVDRETAELVRDMNAGEVGALIISGVNPAYDYYASEEFTTALAKVPLKISLNPALDETSRLVDYVCPPHHFLEAWDDAEPVRGVFSLNQPTIAPLFQTRGYQESLLGWTGDRRPFYDVLRQWWKDNLFTRQKAHATFDEFWDHSLRDGFAVVQTQPSEQAAFVAGALSESVEKLKPRSADRENKLAALLYEKIALRDGAHANNPWLHELPDPISKITWDNYACVSPALAERFEIEEGRIVLISNEKTSIELPAHIQPGQHDDCVAIALGYGRTSAGKAGDAIGANAYPLVRFDNGTFQYQATGITLEKTPARVQLASTQLHQTLDGRPLIKEFTLDDYLKEHKGEEQSKESKSIWKDYQYGEHKWAMVVDLNACIGCSACILSCQGENNVPVVGKDEVRRQREMHWIRLDRYMLGPDDNPTVAYQPVMCNQCDNASCESVCPVLATVHSSEGLNMQVYNRCVGTRYCENNCPYKVRRFNWFENKHPDPIANLALNPDVTVRSRGVMEKCTFCVQRIEEAKIHARNEGRNIRDGEIQTACQQSCPTRAISFGDLVDVDSRVGKLKHDERDYILLEEVNLRPQISYLAKVRRSTNVNLSDQAGKESDDKLKIVGRPEA
ncbi:MAG TPA: 4Fe-4S dicluster domain-containing protein [Blastocatellia bacterium]|nr:4Fe-4S dicluster domain-containing protein [Blastocatellia bacterium]